MPTRWQSPEALMREIERGELRAPARVFDIDVNGDYGDEVVDVARFETAWCLVRRDRAATATRFLDLADISTVTLKSLGEYFRSPDIDCPPEPFVALDKSLTVVICTRDRRDGLLATLGSLAEQSDSKFDVLIVDNSSSGEVASTLTEFDDLSIRCCHEPAPGLSHARNLGLTQVQSELVAWIDDDEVADRDWVASIKAGFASPCEPAAVAGVMLPAELETDAQVNFERYGGFNKGRGMQPEVLCAHTSTVFDPLYPLPNFGAGGNMAFQTTALREVGGFDTCLGAGTLTHGGEETRALSLILESGSAILHWPLAVTWHYHRRTPAELEKQFYGYSAGLTAYYMSLLLSSPKYVWRILKFIPPGVQRLLANRASGKPDGPPQGFPEELLRAGRRGLLMGALLYLREARRQSRKSIVEDTKAGRNRP
jgi:hypothetical protein